jgi:hypothetical protein
MTPAEVQSQLRSARFEMERVCKLLESPTPAVLDRCGAAMERVIGELDAGRKWMPQAGKIGVAEARRLRSVAHRARALLNLAANYHSRWQCILASMTGGYTVRGAPAPLLSKARLSIQG